MHFVGACTPREAGPLAVVWWVLRRLKPPDFLLCSKQKEDGVDFLQSSFVGVAGIPLPCRNPAAAPLQQEGLLLPSAAGLQLDFFLLTKFLAQKNKKNKNKKIEEEFLHQQLWELRPTGGRRMHYTDYEGEAASAVRPAKGFIELCFRGPWKHFTVGEGNHHWPETPN